MLAWAAASGNKAVFEAALASLGAKLPNEVRHRTLPECVGVCAVFQYRSGP